MFLLKGKIFLLFIWFFVLSGVLFGASASDIHIDVVNTTPYFDYLVNFDSPFSLELPDFDSLLYIKVIPSDINYILDAKKISINTEKKGILIIKYKGTEFLESQTNFEKTFDFELLGNSEIALTSDTNISSTNPEPENTENNTLVWKTDKSNFILHILLKKESNTIQTIITVVISLIIIGLLCYWHYRRKKTVAPSLNNLLLDDIQQKILARVTKEKAVNQQEIGKELNLQKSHLSKVLNKMERNNLIERKKVGKINKIVLAEKTAPKPR